MKITPPNALAVKAPHLICELHPSKNSILTSQISYSSHKKVWWQCIKGHEWEAAVSTRTAGHGCPYCKKKKASPENNLLVCKPELAREFHPVKNAPITPEIITPASNKKVWWQCKKGHEWKTSVNNRFNGTKCPVCSGRKLSAENNLAARCPHLISEWHPSKNGKLTPCDVFPRSNAKIWWLCNQGHEWQATPGGRYAGNGCPYCGGKRATAENNLAVAYHHLALKWSHEKNCDVTPEQVKPGSSRKVWWKCEKDHEWESPIKHMVKSQKCPYCIGRRVSLENNFAAKCPNLLSEWHDKKISPFKFTSGSNKKVSWKCRFGHVWEAAISSRTRGHGCPKCRFQSSRLEVRIYCEIKHFFPDTLWQTKIEKREVDVFIPSHSLAIEVDGWYWHSFKDTVSADAQKSKLLERNGINLIRVMDDRMEKNENTVCMFYRKDEHERGVVVRLLKLLVTKLSLSSNEIDDINKYFLANHYINEEKYNEIISCLPAPKIEDSVLGYDNLVKEWNNDKNVLPPSYYSYGSKVKIWWICKYKHEWEATINSRSGGRDCPYCKKKRASPENNLLACSPELAREFHPIKNEQLTPDMVTPRSGKKVWWQCKRGHEWKAVVGNRYLGAKCPDCVGRKLSKNHNLAVKYPELIPQWHVEKNFPLTPFDTTPKSNKKFWWICQKGHEWLTSPEKRTRGHGCHVCSGHVYLLSRYNKEINEYE